ncbi:LysR substrate-binding domain-containing protein [Pseudomonas sp. SA3-5]|uniref:LysR substrate-binding domain-containing protein n=1 Tax=Pseudomonas aestuarii TaxID=3018340 RepID=A0ABT4XKV0_9PSED|nr:LysR family transcriptional regulator [Pseudomonas aestuarii]MDA7088839.1 LysR substrate-binding domain-containing protein [Pseudomonas aestuarii]
MLADLKIVQLRHFVWVHELQGFHAAAEKAHRTQPAISLSIRDLEGKLGQALFEKRNARAARPELTPFGVQFMAYAKELIAHHDRVIKDMSLIAQHKSGHLRIASVPSIASRLLPDILTRFIGDATDLHVSLFDDSSEVVLAMVENQQVDFGIASLWEAESDIRFIPIWEDSIGVVCRSDHRLAGETELSWQQLRGERLIANGTSRLLADTAAEDLVVDAQFYMSNMISLLAMLEAGMGITTLPRFAFPLEHSQLRFIPLSEPLVVRDIGIVCLANRSLPVAAQALFDFILRDNELDPGQA